MTSRTVAVLLAGGIGARAGLGFPKQLALLGGTTILERSLVALHDHPGVSGVVLVMAPGHLGPAHELASSYPGVLAVVEGGATRSDSTLAALAALAEAGETTADVLVHDAARPLLSAGVVDRCLAALAEHQAVGVAVPSTDTVFHTDADGRIVEVPPRERLWRAQTPQGFRQPVLREAYRKAGEDPAFVATDDCSVVVRYLPEVPVVVVEGDERNLKVTGPDDLAIAERLLSDG